MTRNPEQVAAPVNEELGFYILAGAGGAPADFASPRLRKVERLGFGTGFISERWNVKEASSLVGAACGDRQNADRHRRNELQPRHPLVTASWATTMHRLSHGRFTLESTRRRPPCTAPSASQMSPQLISKTGRWSPEGCGTARPSSTIKAPWARIRCSTSTVTSTKTSPRAGRVRSQEPRTRRARLRRRHPAHLLHPGHARTECESSRPQQQKAGRPGLGTCLVLPGDHRRSPARRSTPEKLAGRLGTYLQGRRPARRDERLGSGSAAALS